MLSKIPSHMQALGGLDLLTIKNVEYNIALVEPDDFYKFKTPLLNRHSCMHGALFYFCVIHLVQKTCEPVRLFIWCAPYIKVRYIMISGLVVNGPGKGLNRANWITISATRGYGRKLTGVAGTAHHQCLD